MAALKEILIQRIQETDDPKILANISRLLEVNTDSSEVYEFSEEQLAAIAEAEDQISKGQYLSNEQANKEADEWLKNR